MIKRSDGISQLYCVTTKSLSTQLKAAIENDSERIMQIELQVPSTYDRWRVNSHKQKDMENVKRALSSYGARISYVRGSEYVRELPRGGKYKRHVDRVMNKPIRDDITENFSALDKIAAIADGYYLDAVDGKVNVVTNLGKHPKAVIDMRRYRADQNITRPIGSHLDKTGTWILLPQVVHEALRGVLRRARTFVLEQGYICSPSEMQDGLPRYQSNSFQMDDADFPLQIEDDAMDVDDKDNEEKDNNNNTTGTIASIAHGFKIFEGSRLAVLYIDCPDMPLTSVEARDAYLKKLREIESGVLSDVETVDSAVMKLLNAGYVPEVTVSMTLKQGQYFIDLMESKSKRDIVSNDDDMDMRGGNDDDDVDNGDDGDDPLMRSRKSLKTASKDAKEEGKDADLYTSAGLR